MDMDLFLYLMYIMGKNGWMDICSIPWWSGLVCLFTPFRIPKKKRRKLFPWNQEEDDDNDDGTNQCIWRKYGKVLSTCDSLIADLLIMMEMHAYFLKQPYH